jgi:hypothetical protein
MNAPLPANVAALLQDEAYAILCRESLNDELEKLQASKQQILTTRPPFGMLASSQTRTVFQTSLRAALDNEAGLRTRLDQIGQIDLWLREAIENALQDYLPLGSTDYLCCHEACQVVTRWESAIQALHELSVALARDAHAVFVTIKPAIQPKASASLIRQTRQRAFVNLRATVLAMQAGVTGVEDVRKEFMKLCDAQADALQLPEPPAFRNAAWVDRLAKLSDGQICAELEQCEVEARAFGAAGISAILREGAEVHQACSEAGRAILAKYWRQLRVHAQAHYVKVRDLDEVLAELNAHRQAAELARRQASFETATVAALR